MEQAFKDKSTRPKIKYFNLKYFPAAVKPHDSLPGQAAGCQPCRQLDVGQPPQEPGPCQGPTFLFETESSCNQTELVIRSSAPAQYGSLWSPPSPFLGPPWQSHPIQLLGVLQVDQAVQLPGGPGPPEYSGHLPTNLFKHVPPGVHHVHSQIPEPAYQPPFLSLIHI